MKEWKDGNRFMMIWRGGFTYQSKATISNSSSDIIEIIKECYSKKRLVSSEFDHLEFEGGSTLLSKLAPLILSSASWLHHKIDIHIQAIDDSKEIDIRYYCDTCLVILLFRISFQKEVKKLRQLLKTKIT